jgi:hypothetical protein
MTSVSARTNGVGKPWVPLALERKFHGTPAKPREEQRVRELDGRNALACGSE